VVGEQGLLQRPGSRPPRRVIFQPQGLEPPAFSEGIEPEELWLGNVFALPDLVVGSSTEVSW